MTDATPFSGFHQSHVVVLLKTTVIAWNNEFWVK